MTVSYCTADGAGPRACPDWGALYRAALAAVTPTGDDEADLAAYEAARAPIDALRLSEPGHVARNGNPPQNGRCPECGAPTAEGEAP